MGNHWLILGRIGSGLLLAGLVLTSGGVFRSPGLIQVAAAGVLLGAGMGWFCRSRRWLTGPLLLADVAWVTTAVWGAGHQEAGLTMLFPLVSFAAGLTLSGVGALALSLIAGSALIATVVSLPEVTLGMGWPLMQGGLVLILGLVSYRTRVHLESQREALADASLALERLRLDTDTIVQNLGSGVVSIDQDAIIVHFNQVAEDTLGIRGEEARGRSLSLAFPAGASAMVDLMQRGLQSGEPVSRCEVELSLEGGKVVPLGLGTTVLTGAEGEATGVVVLFQNLTEVRRQERLARSRERLAAVGELAAGIAHEIRNSVLPISGSVQILAQELKLDPEQAKLFQIIEKETDNVERFVSDLLRYTRTESLHSRQGDLYNTAVEVVEEDRLCRREGPRVEIEGNSCPAVFDPDQIRQALRNLILNAVDAAGADGKVLVRTGWDGPEQPWIEVEDDGPGIPDRDRSKVLEPFYTSKAGGTGLGLAVVSRIVEDHGGRLDIAKGSEGGARIRLRLPEIELAPTETASAA